MGRRSNEINMTQCRVPLPPGWGRHRTSRWNERRNTSWPWGRFVATRCSARLSRLNIVFVIPFITVAKSKMYWQGVKSRGDFLVPDSFARSQNQCILVSEYWTFVHNSGRKILSTIGSFKFTEIWSSNKNESCSTLCVKKKDLASRRCLHHGTLAMFTWGFRWAGTN